LLLLAFCLCFVLRVLSLGIACLSSLPYLTSSCTLLVLVVFTPCF
jgi:hypothetical protein